MNNNRKSENFFRAWKPELAIMEFVQEADVC